MSEYGGLRPTGRQNRDPSAILLELESEDGFAHTAIAFDALYRAHPALAKNVELVLPFLEFPMVAGLVDLWWWDLTRSVFVYPTGSIWTVNEVLRSYHDRGRKVGARAALELATLGTEILVEASATGGLQGCFSHGNLNPWRIALRDDGEVMILGYGLSQVEIARRRADPTFAIGPDSLRYCPPERLTGYPESDASDTYALALIACELMTGKPLYASHDLAALETNVNLSEGVAMLAKPPPEIPRPVAEILARALVYDPDTRLSGAELADELRAQIRGAPGPSLQEVMADVAAARPLESRPRKKVLAASTRTAAYTTEELAAHAEEESPRSSGRWTAPARRRTEEPVTTSVPERRVRREGELPAGEVRRRNRTDEGAEPTKEVRAARAEDTAVPVPRPEAARPEDPIPPAPIAGEVRRRLRRPAEEAGEAAAPLPEQAAAQAPEAPVPGEGAVRRRLRRISDEGAAAAPPPDEAPTPVPGERSGAPERRILRREELTAEPEGGFRRRLRRDEP